MKVAIIGSNGQLGTDLVKTFSEKHDVVSLTHEQIEITNFNNCQKVLASIKPDLLITTAAMHQVEKCEEDPELSFRVNALGTRNLALAAQSTGSQFVFFSTDYVFDGNGTEPYTTESATNPQSVYGASKLQGEKEAMQYNPDSMIIRTSWVYSEFGKNFVKTMLKLMSEKEELNVVSDQIGSPTYAADLAAVIMQVIASGKWIPGMYHFSNAGVISWYDFALAIKELSGKTCRVIPIPGSQYPTPAKRPAYSVMDTSRLFNSFGMTPKNWKDSLQVCLKKL